MSDTKFTITPWFVVETDNEIAVSCDDYDILTMWTGVDDAHLIAAAPDMYSKLQALVDSGNLQGQVENEVLDLLSKARGE